MSHNYLWGFVLNTTLFNDSHSVPLLGPCLIFSMPHSPSVNNYFVSINYITFGIIRFTMLNPVQFNKHSLNIYYECLKAAEEGMVIISWSLQLTHSLEYEYPADCGHFLTKIAAAALCKENWSASFKELREIKGFGKTLCFIDKEDELGKEANTHKNWLCKSWRSPGLRECERVWGDKIHMEGFKLLLGCITKMHTLQLVISFIFKHAFQFCQISCCSSNWDSLLASLGEYMEWFTLVPLWSTANLGPLLF